MKKTGGKLNQAADTISATETRTRQMGRASKSVAALPQAQVQVLRLLPQAAGGAVVGSVAAATARRSEWLGPKPD